MNRATMALAATAAIALSSCGPKTETTNSTTTDTSSVTSTSVSNSSGDTLNATAPAASPAQTFVNTAAASDAFEIATSKLALTNSTSAAIKKFANQMITAHEGSTAKLKTLTAGLSPALTPDPTLTTDQQAKLDGMKGEKGADFDASYATAQQDGHQATLDAVKAYAATGDVPALKTFASGLVPVVTAHLNMAKALK